MKTERQKDLARKFPSRATKPGFLLLHRFLHLKYMTQTACYLIPSFSLKKNIFSPSMKLVTRSIAEVSKYALWVKNFPFNFLQQKAF
jgi:hypothetical protein